MDPRLLLGVGIRAGRSEVRAAHRRLRDAVAPVRGGTDELVRLVDAAAATLLGRPATLHVDAHRVLDVVPGAPAADVHAAYRRLVRLVHPDLGGTDELFRVVASAHEMLTSSRRRIRRPFRPPSPPPPRGPYRAPPPDQRHAVPTWRAVRDLAEHSIVLVLLALVVIAAFEVATILGAMALAGVLVASGAVLRPAIDGLLRAGIVLLDARVRVAEAVEPERFLEATCLDAPVGRQRDQELYAAYVRWCAQPGRGHPVARWVFVERLRTLGLLFVKSSSWDDGLWVGITLAR